MRSATGPEPVYQFQSGVNATPLVLISRLSSPSRSKLNRTSNAIGWDESESQTCEPASAKSMLLAGMSQKARLVNQQAPNANAIGWDIRSPDSLLPAAPN